MAKFSVGLALMMAGILAVQRGALADDATTAASSLPSAPAASAEQEWNFHAQSTVAVQGDPAFPADYSGLNSLESGGQTRETVSVDLFAGLRLWDGAEAHVDALAWQGFGLSNTEGVDAFPNAVASKIGTANPALTFSRLFVRQTIGLGGDQEDVSDDQLTLAGKRDISRLTLTAGRLSATDFFDTNTYANNPDTQFMNWAFVNNISWDYPADSLGFTTGLAAEWNEPNWTLRYGFFQMPSSSNFSTLEDRYLTYPAIQEGGDAAFWQSWGMAMEWERRYTIDGHPGAIRPLVWVNEAKMGLYSQAAATPGADILATRDYRFKYGVGLNWEQEVATNVGIFSRLGWNDGREEAWAYSDVNYSGSVGISVSGAAWGRANDTFGLACVASGISSENQHYLQAGGLGILDGDGALAYGWEKVVETYYDWDIWHDVHFALDYQFVDDPAFNSDRGPVSIFAARVHWQF